MGSVHSLLCRPQRVPVKPGMQRHRNVVLEFTHIAPLRHGCFKQGTVRERSETGQMRLFLARIAKFTLGSGIFENYKPSSEFRLHTLIHAVYVCMHTAWRFSAFSEYLKLHIGISRHKEDAEAKINACRSLNKCDRWLSTLNQLSYPG